jgi:hypothetical protein
LKKLSQYKLRTDICLKDENELADFGEVERCMKHYRGGMGSIKKLRIHNY